MYEDRRESKIRNNVKRSCERSDFWNCIFCNFQHEIVIQTFFSRVPCLVKFRCIIINRTYCELEPNTPVTKRGGVAAPEINHGNFLELCAGTCTFSTEPI